MVQVESKKSELKEQGLSGILKESEDVHNRRYDGAEKLGHKVARFFAFNTAFFVLFIRFVDFPSGLLMRITYVGISALFIIITFLLIDAYKAMGYKLI